MTFAQVFRQIKRFPHVIVRVPSMTSDREYEIRIGKDQNVYCTCPSWKFNTRRTTGGVKRRSCKHLDAFWSGKYSA